MWKDKLQEIVQEKNLYGEKVNIGAEEEIGLVKDIHLRQLMTVYGKL